MSGTRLTRAARREQLLDAAAQLGAASLDSVTMEGLAAQAGVSKALPYKFFANRDEVLANYAARTPAGPVLTPADVADAVYLLCLPEANMINGHTLVVDGGFAISG